MRAEKRTDPVYVLTISEDERAFLQALLNTAPSRLEELCFGYTSEEIMRVTKHGSRNSMHQVIKHVVEEP